MGPSSQISPASPGSKRGRDRGVLSWGGLSDSTERSKPRAVRQTSLTQQAGPGGFLEEGLTDWWNSLWVSPERGHCKQGQQGHRLRVAK